jgi:hypothetical protein
MVAPEPDQFIMVDARDLAPYPRETQLAQRGN